MERQRPNTYFHMAISVLPIAGTSNERPDHAAVRQTSIIKQGRICVRNVGPQQSVRRHYPPRRRFRLRRCRSDTGRLDSALRRARYPSTTRRFTRIMGSRYPIQRTLAATPRFTVGRDHHGCWVVQDSLGRVGGLFASEAAALHFADEESNHDVRAVCRAPAGKCVEFDGLSTSGTVMAQSAPPRRYA
jgi:hypothetical protein